MKKKPSGRQGRARAEVAVIMGSINDKPVMMNAIKALREYGIDVEIKIVSAHRTPEFMFEYASSAERRGLKVIIAGAGGAAHLPGMVASLTTLPVIGVPITVGKLRGLDALLSIAQMPKGVPVASVAVDNSYNAGLLAVRILGAHNPQIRARVAKKQNEKRKEVLKLNK
jgi:5-(carboxyamino)imidazole ribonucleotide mutase